MASPEPARGERPRFYEQADSPEQLKIDERNAFYESLSIEARERFLAALEEAQARGLDEEASWREAVIAAETTYSRVQDANL